VVEGSVVESALVTGKVLSDSSGEISWGGESSGGTEGGS